MEPEMWRATGGRRRGRGACGSSSRRLRGSGVVAAAVAFVVDDLRNPAGIARPLLRSAAQALVTSRRDALHRMGARYLRVDPPVELARREDEIVDGTAVDVTGETYIEAGRESAPPPG